MNAITESWASIPEVKRAAPDLGPQVWSSRNPQNSAMSTQVLAH